METVLLTTRAIDPLRKYMTTLADLRKRRTTDFSKLTKAFESASNSSDSEEGFWKLERDKAGNATATIRFLPAYTGEDAGPADELPWVTIHNHAFQGPTGKWYIENCLSTIGKEDPVMDMNRQLWKGSETDKEQAKRQKRNTKMYSQILVVSDPKHPENNGKVFFFKFGKKIMEKIMDAAKPTFEDEAPVNVFDLWEGANFKLRIKTVDKYPNYDSSSFDKPSAIGDDDEILEVVNQQKSLQRFMDPSNFKSYEELEKKLQTVLSNKPASTKSAEDIVKSLREEDNEEITEEVQEKEVKKEKVTSKSTEVTDDDDMEKWFSENMD